MPSRRDFLRSGGRAASGLWLSSPWLSSPLAGALRLAAARSGGLTYGLFFDEDRLARMRTWFLEDPRFAPLREYLEHIDRAAERAFVAEDLRTNDHLIHLLRLYQRAPELAFYHLMTGDEDAADLAAELIRAIMRFPKWDYFLEAGTDVVGIQRASGATVAVSLCADWLGTFIDDAERTEWLRTMGERGCEACFRSIYGMRYKDRVVGWSMDETSTYFEHRPGDRIDLSNWPTILDRTNLKAVPASALALGAVTYEREFGPSDDTARWIEQAVYSVASFEELYARDGSYDENISYANYTGSHLAQACDVLRRAGKADLFDTINWTGFATFALEMTMPLRSDPSAIVNFGDARAGMQSALPFWIARHAHDRRSQWFGHHLAREHDAWSLVWYDPAVPAEAPPAAPHLWKSDLDWIVARTGYTPDDLVVALRSGPPANHEHADRNTLIVKAYGEQLVVDPERPPYSYSDPSWMLRTTAGHSALLIDGAGHQYHDGSEGTNASDASARIIRADEYHNWMSWTSDATPAYRLVLPDVESVTRTVLVLHTLPAVVVLDKVVKRTTPSRIQARYFAYNKDGGGRITSGGDGFRIHRPWAVLEAGAVAQGGVRVFDPGLPIPDDVAAQHPRVAVETTTESTEPFLVTVLLPEPGTGGQAEARLRRADGGAYVATLHQGTRRAVCRIHDTGTIPEFTVSL